MELIKYNHKDIVLCEEERFPNHWRKNWSKENMHALLLVKKGEELLGRIAIYLNVHFRKKDAAFLGAYECIEDQSVNDFLMNAAIEEAKNQGIKKVFGPIDGSTWNTCLLYTSPSPRDATLSRMPSSA